MTTEALDRRSNPAPTGPRATRYSRVAIVLHWLIAALVLSTIPLGWYSASGSAPPRPPGASAPTGAPAGASPATASRPPSPPPKSAAQQAATNVHKTIGIVILFFTLLRVGWRLTHKPPPLPASMVRPLRWLAKTSHALFYVLLIVMPMSGWWTSSAVPDPRRHAFGFGFVDIPFLPVTQSWPSAGLARFIHVNLSWLMVALVALHIAAALKHHFLDRDDVLRRMLPRKV